MSAVGTPLGVAEVAVVKYFQSSAGSPAVGKVPAPTQRFRRELHGRSTAAPIAGTSSVEGARASGARRDSAVQALAAVLLIVGGALGLVASVPHATGVARGRTRPSRWLGVPGTLSVACIAVALLIRLAS